MKGPPAVMQSGPQQPITSRNSAAARYFHFPPFSSDSASRHEHNQRSQINTTALMQLINTANTFSINYEIYFLITDFLEKKILNVYLQMYLLYI